MSLNAKGTEMSEWQPIETAPKDGMAVLLFWPSRAMFGKCGVFPGAWTDDQHATKPKPGWFSHELAAFWGRRAVREGQPTHWMPLPEPPTPASLPGSAPRSRG